MDKKLRYAQLARCLLLNNGSVSMAVKNKKLIAEINEAGHAVIDIDQPLNRLWIKNMESKKGVEFDPSRIFYDPDKKTPLPKKKKPGMLVDAEKLTKTVLDQEKKKAEISKFAFRKAKAEAQKAEKDVILKDLQIAKLEGASIPVDAVKSFIIYITETYRSQSNQQNDKIIDIFSQQLELSQKQIVNLRKELTKKSSFLIKEMKIQLIEGLEDTIKSYQEVRARGEKS